MSPGSNPTPRLRLGLHLHAGKPRESPFEGSALLWPLGAGTAYVSVEPRHWGPGWAGSPILDAAAPAMPAVGWRKTAPTAFRTRWLAWLGPWGADVFLGRLSGHDEPERPRFTGLRLQAQPLPGLEIGLSRALQWGGHGRPSDLRTLLRGLAGQDNLGGAEDEPGNQLAGVDLRYGFGLGPGDAAVYGQVIGEDEAGGLPIRHIVQAGAEWATGGGGRSLRVFGEWADLVAGRVFGDVHYGTAYRHHIYEQGYTQRTLPLGHPVGGDARLATLGAVLDAGRTTAMGMVHLGRAAAPAQRFDAGARLAGVNAAVALELGPWSRIGLSLWWWRAGSERDGAVQAFWHTAL